MSRDRSGFATRSYRVRANNVTGARLKPGRTYGMQGGNAGGLATRPYGMPGSKAARNGTTITNIRFAAAAR